MRLNVKGLPNECRETAFACRLDLKEIGLDRGDRRGRQSSDASQNTSPPPLQLRRRSRDCGRLCLLPGISGLTFPEQRLFRRLAVFDLLVAPVVGIEKRRRRPMTGRYARWLNRPYACSLSFTLFRFASLSFWPSRLSRGARPGATLATAGRVVAPRPRISRADSLQAASFVPRDKNRGLDKEIGDSRALNLSLYRKRRLQMMRNACTAMSATVAIGAFDDR
jgi:hypothetical protein